MESSNIEELVKAVYIDPIRSVLIIDDDYPTWEETLYSSEETEESRAKVKLFSAKGWKKDPRVKKVIMTLRSPDHNLILDVSDGTDISLAGENKKIGNLHQTDLLILDYQLNGTSGDGTKAIRIAREINSNNQFNLVIVQTSAVLDTAFQDMLLGLLAPCEDEDRVEFKKLGLGLIEAREADDQDIVDKIRGAINEAQYFSIRKSASQALAYCHRNEQPFSAFKTICDCAGWRGGSIRNVLEWASADFEDRNIRKMHTSEIPNLRWSDGEAKWIRSSTAFIAFTNKTDASDLIKDLLDTLVNWAPRPSRLLLAKLRKELEEKGSIAEDIALGNNHVLAKWYQALISADEDKQSFLLRETLNRHCELLLEAVSQEVVQFGKNIINSDISRRGKLISPEGEDQKRWDDLSIIKNHFGVNLSNPGENALSELDHNIFICSTKPSGEHLRTGHIFKTGEDYWVCLSPLCDLVPGQKTAGVFADVGSRMPFVAVRLQKVSGENNVTTTFNRIKPDVQSNRYIFIEENDQKIILCINSSGPTNEGSLPHWYPLYAANYGKFSDGFSLKIYQVSNGARGHLKFVHHETKVITQLRYEYALNLMQRMGNSINRIGLDFSG